MYGTMENVNFNRNCTDNPWNNIYYTQRPHKHLASNSAHIGYS